MDNNGAIHPKLLGRMYLKGLSLEKARSLLKRRFGSIFDLSSSQIDITLTYSRVITTNIVGEVERPGSYTISAVNTDFNALMASGGVSDIGSVREIYVKRKGKIVRKLDVYEFLMDPKGDYDFFLENDDYIFIPVIGRTVTVVGEVKREHTYELIEEEHLTKLIDFAGGLTSAAYTTNIQIKRYLDSEEILIDLSLDSLTRNNLDFELQDGDHVIIHKIPEGITNYVEIIGAVKLPGKYQLKEGQKISDVINIAERILYNTYLPRGYVVRINEDLSIQYIPFNLGSVMSNMNSGENIRLQSFDLINIYAKDDFKDDFNISIEGAVRIPGVYPFGNGLKLKDVLYFGGGLKHGAANNRIEISRILNFNDAVNQALPTRITVLTVQVDFNLNIDDDAAAFELQPFDQIFVRTTPEFEFQRNVTISGEILYAGTYSLLSKEERLSDVIARAGGVTDWAFLEGATLFRVDNEAGYLFMDVKKVLTHQNTKTNYILKEGDIIVIPKINELIMIAGEIEYPGTDVINAPYHKNRCARFYIRKYGAGFTKDAKKRKTYVVLPGGFVKNTTGFGLFNIYPRVKKGSTIVVVKKVKREKEDKEKVEIDWNVFIEKTTVKITGLLTLYFLITNL